jgi:hypothetical protein
MQGASKAILLGLLMLFLTRDPFATLVASGGALALDTFF